MFTQTMNVISLKLFIGEFPDVHVHLMSFYSVHSFVSLHNFKLIGSFPYSFIFHILQNFVDAKCYTESAFVYALIFLLVIGKIYCILGKIFQFWLSFILAQKRFSSRSIDSSSTKAL